MKSYFQTLTIQGFLLGKQNVYICVRVILFVMFGWCCQQSNQLNEQLFIYRANSQKFTRSVFSISQVNPKIAKEGEQYQIFVNSNYENLFKDCILKKQQFVDRDFDIGKQQIRKRQGRRIAWRRLRTFTDNKLLLSQTRSINQIATLNKNDSYFLPTIAALASQRKIIRNILNDSLEFSQWGIYRLNVCINGKPKQIVLDDLIPVFQDNQNRTAFCKAQKGLLWILLFEKAYAKIKNGYENIESGYAHQVLTTFTLAPCLYYLIPLNFDFASQENVWVRLLEAKRNNFPILCGSRKQYTCEGILMNQTYPFVDCWTEQVEERQYKMVKLVNIPGAFDHSDNCKIEMCDEGDSIKLQLVEFMRNFQVIDVANIRPTYSSYFYRYTSLKSQFKFYTVEVPQHVSFYLTLQRENQQAGKLRMFLARIIQNSNDFELIGCKLEQIFSDVNLQCCLQKGRYMVCCQSSVEGECFLRVYSQMGIPFQQAKYEGIRFLQNICWNIGVRSKQEHYILSKNSKDWYFAKIMFEQIGLGFIVISLDPTSNIKCSIKYSRERIEEEGFRVLNKKDSIYQIMLFQQKLVLIFEIINSKKQYLSFPPKSLQIKVII